MSDYNTIPNGLLINSQINLNPKVAFDTLVELADLGNNNSLAVTYYNNMLVFCAENTTFYIWREKVGGEVGEVAGDFQYPSNYISFDFDYSDKIYNFYVIDISSLLPNNLVYTDVANIFTLIQTALGYKTPDNDSDGFLKSDGSVDTATKPLLDAFDEQIGLRETAATGVIEGGLMTEATISTIDITAGSGEIIDGYTDRRNPTRVNVTWTEKLGVVINMPDFYGTVLILIDNTGAVVQQATVATATQRRNLIQLGFVSYSNGTILEVTQTGMYSNEVGNVLYDWLYYTDRDNRVKGLGLKPVDNVLSVWGDSGELFSPGINVSGDLTNANIKLFAAIGNSVTPEPFNIVFSDGSSYLTNQTVMPTVVETSPGITDNLNGDNCAIHYMYRTLGNKLILQLGTYEYPNANSARDNLQVDASSYAYFDGSGAALLVAQVYVEGNATDFNNINDAGIVSTITGSGTSTGVPTTNFLNLPDVFEPSYVGKARQPANVNDTETGLIFGEIPMVWKGTWVDASYLKNDVTLDNSWTMIANKDTIDRPAPQETGAQEDSIIKPVSFTTDTNLSVIEVRHIFTTTKTGFLKGIEVYTPHYGLDSISKVTMVTAGSGKVINNPVLSANNWTLLAVDSIALGIGVQLMVIFEYYNSVAANSINGPWASNVGTGEPPAQDFNIDNLITPTIVEISHTDANSSDRSADLDNIISGSIITIFETGDTERNIKFEVDVVSTAGTTSTSYTVLTNSIINGVKDIRGGRVCSIKIDAPISVSSDYSRVSDYYPTNNPSWATIETELYYSGVLQADAGDDDAYGINLIFQEATISPDWDLVATSQTISGNEEGAGVPIEIVDNLTTADPAKALSANMGKTLEDTKPTLGNASTEAHRGDHGVVAYNHSQSAHAPTNAEVNVNADWNASSGDALILNKPTLQSLEVTVVADCGTTIPLGNIILTLCNMGLSNSNSTFILSGTVIGGYAEVLINNATEPTITGAVKIVGSTFIASTDMYLCVKNRGRKGNIDYWFEQIL